jgi:hypothetical protein
MSAYDDDMEMWARIRGMAGCGVTISELEEEERDSKFSVVQQLASVTAGGPGRLVSEEEINRVVCEAVGTGEEAIVWREFQRLEQMRYRVFVDGCCAFWLGEARKTVEEDVGVSEEEQECTGCEEGCAGCEEEQECAGCEEGCAGCEEEELERARCE